MPGFYPEDEYDLAGFSVGIVDRDKIIDNGKMQVGDTVIALPSSGVHSNGFSLVRKVFDVENSDIKMPAGAWREESSAKRCSPRRRSTLNRCLHCLTRKSASSGISHITGGGFYENIPRSIPDGLSAVIDRKSLRILPVFDLIAHDGNIPERDMFNTFNMGVGMSIVVPESETDTALSVLKENGEDAYVIGRIGSSDEKVRII